jgi:branched-chain amino acid transport system permease protein
MTDFLQLFFSGLATGAIYSLAALGFTLLWQASGTINFAQGEFVMLPAFMMLGFMSIDAPLAVSFTMTVVLAVFVLGWVFKRGLVDPLFKFGMMPIVVATIGLSIAMRNGLRAGYSAEAHPFPSLFADKLFNIAGVTITLADVGTFAVALILVFVVQAFMTKTVTGRAMQAVAQNTESASVLGINVPRMIFYAFAINAVLAVAAALLVTPTYLAKFDMGESLGTKAFFAAIIGGFNNSRGALLGGLIVGVCENLAAAYISPAYKDAVALVIFMVVILFKPQGLLGKKVERKV